MANAREIQNRMKSIQDTMKITNAMYMISSSKLKKAKLGLDETEPYFITLQEMFHRILYSFPEIENIYFDNRLKIAKEDRKIGYIVITADKGLAGAYNHNVIKLAEKEMAKRNHPLLFVLGELGRHYFESRNIPIEESVRYTVQNPTLHRARQISRRVIELYNSGEVDEIYIIYTRMSGAMQTEVEFEQLLPLRKSDFKDIPIDMSKQEFAYMPSASDVLNSLVPDYLAGFIYGALVESYSSEQNSRMMAMESATNSAKDMLHNLSIEYNRVRQAAITQEITEVISGAKAQKNKGKH